MSPYTANLSHDGYSYTKNTGLIPGLCTYGVIKPERRIRATDDVWEAIVVGAGYTGLVAARDLVKAGELSECRRVGDGTTDTKQAKRLSC